MAARLFLKIDSTDLKRLSEHLRVYAEKCDEAATKLEQSSVNYVITDGYSATVDGIGRLRKLLKDFVGELGLPPDELPADRDRKVAEIRPIPDAEMVAEQVKKFSTAKENLRKQTKKPKPQ